MASDGMQGGFQGRLAERLADFPRWQTPFRVLLVIWSEFTGGLGAWGALRPLVATALAFVPFLFLGQHFNRQHRKGFDWAMLQIPLLIALLWPLLWLWSIFDAYQTAMLSVADDYSVAA